MEQIVVKSEMQNNGEILLFYVDENGGNEEGVLTTVENIENQAVQLQQDNSFIIEDVGDLSNDINLLQSTIQKEHWAEEDIKRLLTFYNDNKQTFISGPTTKTHLWTVACKTMLVGKTPQSCEVQLQYLKSKYAEICGQVRHGMFVKWEYFALCHQVFHDEVVMKIDGSEENANPVARTQPKLDTMTRAHSTPSPQSSSEGFFARIPTSQPLQLSNESFVVKKVNSRPAVDEKVELMLNLYLKYIKNFQQEYWSRGLWETIATEIGDEDGLYWQKRFLNYKQHYIRLLDKRSISGSDGINWPYLEIFDRIYQGDEEFRKKYLHKGAEETAPPVANNVINTVLDWDNTERTVLVKYCFDCYDEFEDPTIPNDFLWNEIGRLLDKSAVSCKSKFEELKSSHLNKYMEGTYDMTSRKPIEILFDNIISKEIASQVANIVPSEHLEVWKTEEIDELVQFFYERVEMYKDPLCHFVCWAAISKRLKRPLQMCREQWEDLVTLYRTILNDKKEDPDMQIDWRYIEWFDRIFDYGMDENLLMGYDKMMMLKQSDANQKIGVKKVSINLDERSDEKNSDDDEYYDERGFSKGPQRQVGDSKAFKILEYYQKNKDKFNTKKRNNKNSLWEVLAKQIGISPQKCAHRFRNLKQVYTAYVQREINKPDMPIVWPYYVLCKKVFGYRAIKSKLKNGNPDYDEGEWSAKEIKQLINYFARHFREISDHVDDVEKWTDLATDIGKSVNSCKDKFLELRKSFRKLKTMRSRNPDVKISWKYFRMFERIYDEKEGQDSMEVDGEEYVEMHLDDDDNNDQDEDDYQCIIVIPEGQDISDIGSSQIIVQDKLALQETANLKPPNKWTKRAKKLLLIFYINYIRSHKGKEIDSKQMWAEIAAKLPNKTPVACRKMFAKLKATYKQNEHDIGNTKTKYLTLLEKIMRLKPKFVKSQQSKALTDARTYKDVSLPYEKVEQALRYYVQHIEEFTSPKFEKKYLWTELANHISEPVTKVFNKINYLKQYFCIETNDVAGQMTPFGDLLRDILAKEVALKLVLDSEPKPETESLVEDTWTDGEKEQLLEWYLSNLEKFKNPKFVRSYLWMEASNILNKSALVCSKMMSEIRTEYRNMVRERPEELQGWRFHDLCQKIYGTGKKGTTSAA